MAFPPTDWQLQCIEMKQRGAHLLESSQWSDIKFIVGTEPNQVIYEGHKLILAMASPVFEAMFYGSMAERNDPIQILDVQPGAFKALLEYIYTDEINITSFDKACELCYGAKKYMLPHLVKECTNFLWSDLNPKNACRAYEFARLFEENVLMEKCIQIISTNTREVLNDSSFEYVDLNTMITVFSQDHLNVDSEIDLFEAAARYARAQEKRGVSPAARTKSPTPSTSKEVVNVDSSAENSPQAVAEPNKVEPANPLPGPEPKSFNAKSKDGKDKPFRKVIEKIRFLTLTPQQFAEGPARSSLLTESESFAVLMNILSSNTDVPMPEGFSNCRVPRKQLFGQCTSNNMPTFLVDTPSPVVVEYMFGGNERPSNPHHSSQHGYGPVCHRSTRNEGAIACAIQHVAAQHDSKMYCQRFIRHDTDCYNSSLLDCSVTFMVDKNICLLGVQIPTQVHPSRDDNAGSYSELLYAHLLDVDGARLTYTHYTSRVTYGHFLDIMFNRPVYIQRNKVYKVAIVLNKEGWYPTGTCAHQAVAGSVFFSFGIGQSSDSLRDGLIRSIIFSY